jgi:magnesium transporter
MKKILNKSTKVYKNEDTAAESVEHLISNRFPWLIMGLLGGLVTTILMSHTEDIIKADIRLAFFIPIIVYLSDAVGSQTETIYIRAITQKKVHTLKYLLKEVLVGFGLGAIFGLLLGIFALYWLNAPAIGLTIGLTVLINLTLAPISAVVIPGLLRRGHSDPALGSGPVVTIIRDLLSLLVYFIIASMIIF